MLYLLNISGAFIVSNFQLPFVLKVFPTTYSLILLIPIFNIKHEIYKIYHNSKPFLVMNYFCNSVTGALKPSQPDQCLNLHFSFTMQILHQLTFQTNYKFSLCPYNRLTIRFIPMICKRHHSHTLSQTFTLATLNFHLIQSINI